MNQITFLFKNTKPVSLNNMYVTAKNGRRFKSKNAVELEKHMTCQMFTQKPEIFDFENSCSMFDHYLSCRIIYFMPKTKLITKKGYISKKSGDITENLNKATVDNVFKFFEKLDDSIICHSDHRKLISSDNNYSIMVTLIRRDIAELLDY